MAKGPSIAMEKKMMIILTVFIVIGFIALVGRLVFLQIITGNFYETKAIEQQLRDITVSPKRGTIYDRNMKPLAQSATVWDIYVSPSNIKDEKQKNTLADDLSKITGISRDTLMQKMNKKTGYEILQSKIEKSEADLVSSYAKKNNLGCIGLVEDSKRYYPFGNFAAQVLGFTGTDNQGLAGIEQQYDSVLKGVPGRAVSAKNAKGSDMPFKYDDYIAPQDGTSVVLTIDEVIQHYLEKHLQDALVEDKVANKVTGIVMDVDTGEILAMATEPDFDPNKPFTITDPVTLASLSKLSGDALTKAKNTALNQMWRNKAISDPYEPGSVFKIVTAASCLEDKAVKPTDTFFDPGYYMVAGRKISCWKAGGHGSETFVDGLKNSCNPVFMQITQRLGAANFFKFFQGFGLTQKTGIDLPGEATSIFHSESDLGPVQLAVSSFGQTFKITPIQLITAIAAVANGGNLVVPHVVKSEVDDNNNIIKTFNAQVKRQVVSKDTSTLLSSLLEQVVTSGTGHNAYVMGYRVAGKTGTSQKIDIDAGAALRIASFGGYAPADHPKVAVLVILDEPHASNNFGGVIAAPVEGEIMADILPYLGVQPQYTAVELQQLNVKTPNVCGMSLADASKALRSAGLTNSTKNVGEAGQKVVEQVPAAGQPIPRGGNVILNTGTETIPSNVNVPNVVGLDANQVNQAIAAAGLNLKLVGVDGQSTDLKSYQQEPAAGTKVKPGAVVTVSFRDNNISVD
jgi:stage V sporulation protein D (sporulation-specific penicillin-binding protein)